MDVEDSNQTHSSRRRKKKNKKKSGDGEGRGGEQGEDNTGWKDKRTKKQELSVGETERKQVKQKGNMNDWKAKEINTSSREGNVTKTVAELKQSVQTERGTLNGRDLEPQKAIQGKANNFKGQESYKNVQEDSTTSKRPTAPKQLLVGEADGRTPNGRQLELQKASQRNANNFKGQEKYQNIGERKDRKMKYSAWAEIEEMQSASGSSHGAGMEYEGTHEYVANEQKLKRDPRRLSESGCHNGTDSMGTVKPVQNTTIGKHRKCFDVGALADRGNIEEIRCDRIRVSESGTHLSEAESMRKSNADNQEESTSSAVQGMACVARKESNALPVEMTENEELVTAREKKVLKTKTDRQNISGSILTVGKEQEKSKVPKLKGSSVPDSVVVTRKPMERMPHRTPPGLEGNSIYVFPAFYPTTRVETGGVQAGSRQNESMGKEAINEGMELTV